jgi:hypothetical protein
LGKTHGILLEALRHREQDFLRYLVILVTALGAFLFGVSGVNGKRFDADIQLIISVLSSSALLVGSWYCLALGYNYRCLTVQVAKIEAFLGLTGSVLVSWPRTRKEFQTRFEFEHRCPCFNRLTFGLFSEKLFLEPPAVISPFYRSCLVGSVLIAVATGWLIPSAWGPKILTILIESLQVVVAVFLPFWYGGNFGKVANAETIPWPGESR